MILRESCADCLKRKHSMNYPPDADPEKIAGYQLKVRETVDECCGKKSSPETIQLIHRYYREYFGPLRDYTKEKKQFNTLMLHIEDEIRRNIEQAQDPLLQAIQYALVGNYIDYAALGNVEEQKLLEMLEEAGRLSIDHSAYLSFLTELENAEKLVYLTDNCGEVVADKELMRQIRLRYPRMQISVIVRGEPVVNDVTLEDADQVGLSEVADQIIGNGCDLTGQVLAGISKEARDLLENADLIISKGQANHEGLSGSHLPIYYMLLCKCPFFMELYRAPMFSPVFAREK